MCCNMSAKAETDESAMQEAETEDEAEEMMPSGTAETSNGGEVEPQVELEARHRG